MTGAVAGPIERFPMPPSPVLGPLTATDVGLRRRLLESLDRDLHVAEVLDHDVAVDAIAGADWFRRERQAWCRG